jgi:hypothetical protein
MERWRQASSQTGRYLNSGRDSLSGDVMLALWTLKLRRLSGHYCLLVAAGGKSGGSNKEACDWTISFYDPSFSNRQGRHEIAMCCLTK